MRTLLVLVLAACGGTDAPSDPTADTPTTPAGSSGTPATSGGGTTGTGGPGDDPCTEAPPPLDVVLGDERAFPLQAPSAAWTAPADGCAAVSHFEVAVGLDADDDVAPWTAVDGTAWDGATAAPQPASRDLVVSVRTVDVEGNPSAAVPAGAYRLWDPAQIPGLSLWIDLADRDTVRTDGCVDTAGPGDEVACVLDKSGHDNTFARDEDPFGGPAAPGPEVATLRGLPAAAFHGGAMLSAPDSPSLALADAHFTVLVVDAPDVVDGVRGDEHHYVLCKERAYELAYFEGAVWAAVETHAPGGWEWGAGTSIAPGPQVTVFTHADTTWRFRRDGEPTVEMPAAGGQTGHVDGSGSFDLEPFGTVHGMPLTLGGRPLWGATDYEATLGEVVLIQGAVSDADLAALERYALEKWSR